jgi:hypothetical protein
MENITVFEGLVALSIMNSVVMLSPIMVVQHGLIPVLYMQGYTLSTSDHVSEHGSCQGSFKT